MQKQFLRQDFTQQIAEGCPKSHCERDTNHSHHKQPQPQVGHTKRVDLSVKQKNKNQQSWTSKNCDEVLSFSVHQ